MNPVSMESGLEDRNNAGGWLASPGPPGVSMESGLEDRNNPARVGPAGRGGRVSMESGLEDRNNLHGAAATPCDQMSQWSPA